MPNLASRNHPGTSYLLRDARVPTKGPRSISMPGDGSCCAAPSFNAGSVPAMSLQAVRLVILMDEVLLLSAVMCTWRVSVPICDEPCTTYSLLILVPKRAAPSRQETLRRYFTPAAVRFAFVQVDPNPDSALGNIPEGIRASRARNRGRGDITSPTTAASISWTERFERWDRVALMECGREVLKVSIEFPPVLELGIPFAHHCVEAIGSI